MIDIFLTELANVQGLRLVVAFLLTFSVTGSLALFLVSLRDYRKVCDELFAHKGKR